MARNREPVRWYWPSFGNRADAVQACNAASWAAVFVTGVTALMATVGIFSATPILGITAWAYLDAVVFAVFAWRIRARSRGFAIAALALFVLEKIFQIATQPSAWVGIAMAVILTLLFINGVRGAFAWHRFEAAATRPDTALIEG
jgi:hypothetical protein